MKIYIYREKSDKRGQLTQSIQAIRYLEYKIKIFLLGSDIFTNEMQDVDDLIKQHFSIEDLLGKRTKEEERQQQ